MSGPVFPFTAIVGQDEVKLGLLLTVIDPGIGGILIRGGKGTGKSTAVRALAALLPPVEATDGCPFSCAPAEQAECPGEHTAGAGAVSRPPRLVTLPVGASEERLIGSLDIEAALSRGERKVEPGLLAAAHQGILYVDEVNLLADHLVDALLDAAAMGRNYIERDGVSVSHPARFVLVGTMNPEEGELRPQLLDRFGLMAEAESALAPPERAEVVRRRIAFELDPAGFAARWQQAEDELAHRLRGARAGLARVEVPEAVLEAITGICAACEADGLRADLALYRAARAHAAWAGRGRVTLDDVRATAPLVLAHRRRRLPFEQPGLDREQLERALREFEQGDDPGDERGGEPGGEPADLPPGPGGAPGESNGAGGSASDRRQPDRGPGHAGERPAGVGEALALRPPPLPRRQLQAQRTAGRRRRGAEGMRGRHAGAKGFEAGRDIDAAATIRAAALEGCPRLPVARRHWRAKRRRAEAPALILLIVDASGSMGARKRMEAAKGAVFGLLQDAYLRRDRVAFVAFDGRGARLLLAPTRSVDHAQRALAEFGTGGRTPLWAGLEEAARLVVRVRRKEPELPVLAVVVTDGRANAGTGGLDPVAAAMTRAAALRELGVDGMVLDTEQGAVRLGVARRLAGALGGSHVALDDLEPAAIWSAVRARRAEAAG